MEQGEGRRVGDAGEPGDAVGAAEAVEEVGERMFHRRRDKVRVLGGLLSSGTKREELFLTSLERATAAGGGGRPSSSNRRV